MNDFTATVVGASLFFVFMVGLLMVCEHIASCPLVG